MQLQITLSMSCRYPLCHELIVSRLSNLTLTSGYGHGTFHDTAAAPGLLHNTLH